MKNKQPKKRFFTPKESVNKMTDNELNEFAKFVFENLIEEFNDDQVDNDESR